jgi:cell division protein FtsQ
MVKSKSKGKSTASERPARPNRRRVPSGAPPPTKPRVSGRAGLSRLALRARVRLHELRRPLAWIARIAVLAAVTAGAVASGRLLEQYVRSAQAFGTSAIELSGSERLTREQVLAAAGLALGRNVFEVSPEQAEAALRAHPWVAEAEVTRRLPGSYRITLREQKPVALLALEELNLVSEDGTVFKRLEPSDPIDLPLITGVDPERFRADLALRSSLLVSAVALLQDYRDAGLWQREPLSELHAEPDESFTLYAGKDAMQIRLGQRPYGKKLRRLRQILDELSVQKDRPAYVYLDNIRRPDRVAVRLR